MASERERAMVAFSVTADGTVEIKALPRLTFAVALERVKIDGPVDDAAIHEAWRDEAAKGVMGE